MKESVNSNGETGHDCYEKKAKAVTMKLVMIDNNHDQLHHYSLSFLFITIMTSFTITA
jgi:hypothetical protein